MRRAGFSLHRSLVVLLVAALLACDDDANVVKPIPTAATILINATGIDTLGMLRPGPSVPIVFARFRTGSPCINIPAGEQTLRFRQIRATTDVATADETFDVGGRYTIVVSGMGTTRTVATLRDEYTPPDTATSNLVRFINATSTPGDVYANAPGAAVGAPVVSNLAVIGTGDPPAFVTLPRASTQIRLFNVGTATGTPRANFTLTVPAATRVTNVVFLDPGTPAGATAVRADLCT
jgi:hypothetical protein